LKLPRPGEIDVTLADAIPLPVVPEGAVGTVLVTVTYDVAPGSEDAFLAYSDRLKHVRQRTGGMYWRLFVEEATTGRYLETYLVESWEEHERQHTRETRHDEQLLEDIGKLLVPGTEREPHHYLTAPIPH
jgi:Transmembrane secretion effector